MAKLQMQAKDGKAERSMQENNRILNRENERYYDVDMKKDLLPRSALEFLAAYDLSVRRDTENEFPPFGERP